MPWPAQTGGQSSNLPPPPPAGEAVAGAADQSGKRSDDSSSGEKAQAAPAAASDTSYQHTSGGYQVKLVYLPDFSRPMSVQMHSGVLGTASFQPTLIDGWMLTSLQGSGDNKVAETMTAIAQIIASAEGGGKAATTGATKAGGAPKGTGGGDTGLPAGMLPPGLYGFDYDAVDGRLKGICVVTAFGASGSLAPQIPLCEADVQAARAWIASQSARTPRN